MKYLLVVAHPDDEVLGAGASMWKWSHEGDEVNVAIMCTEAKARAFRPSDAELEDDTDAATNFIGVSKKYEATFPNIEMNTVPHLKLVQFIESAIRESEPDIIITHHPADTNNDHLQTSMACQEAIRLFQRQPSVKPVKEFWYMGGKTVPAYSAAKGGVMQLCKAFSNDLLQYGINVNAIAPGYMDTEMNVALTDPKNPKFTQQRYDELTQRIPAHRWGTPDDMKGCCIFLASHASDYLGGAIIPVDGGYLVM